MRGNFNGNPFTNETHKENLTAAHEYAMANTGCTKVAVGSVLVDKTGVFRRVFGANRAVPDLCKTERGCLRIELYGDDSKNHRGPADCRAIHSEIDAICNAASIGLSTYGATLYVTRYPCEACARAIVAARISTVVFGREQDISEMTKEIFREGKVNYIWAKWFKLDDRLD